MSTAVPGRVVCPRCGANNFDTQALCWKCGSGLSNGPAPALSPAAPLSAAPPLGGASDRMYRPAASVDPSVAMWWGILLAAFFPFVAVPVGMIFMMLDDRRRLEVGKVTLIAGLVFSIIHGLITAVALGGLMQTGLTMMGQRAMQMKNPGLNDNVSDQGLNIPGLPGLSNGKTATPTLSDPPPDVPFPDVPRR